MSVMDAFFILLLHQGDVLRAVEKKKFTLLVPKKVEVFKNHCLEITNRFLAYNF